MKKNYYDPEYDRMVDEDEIKRQFDWFSKHAWFDKTYEQFKTDNFKQLTKIKGGRENGKNNLFNHY